MSVLDRWAIVDGGGHTIEELHESPLTIPEGHRVSYQEFTYAFMVPSFAMDYKTAQGTFLGAGADYQGKISVVGPDLGHVLKLRDRMLRKAAGERVGSFLNIPEGITSPWKRLGWFIRWIARGETAGALG